MKLSVIIPAKNEETSLVACLQAVVMAISFWGEEAEIILVDNGSVDRTPTIAAKAGCKVIIVPNGPVAKLRNLGAEKARGQILAFLDADCLVAREWISCCLEHLNSPQIAAVGTRAVPELTCATWVERSCCSLFAGAPRPDYVKWLGTSNLLIKKNIFIEIGGFDETLETGEDVNLGHRISKHYLIYLEKRIVTVHLRESKTVQQLFRREAWRGKSSISSMLAGGDFWREFPSVAIPSINLLCLLLFFAGLIWKPWHSTAVATGVLLLPLLLMAKKKPKITSAAQFLGCYLIAIVYMAARSWALILEGHSLLSKFLVKRKSPPTTLPNIRH